MFDAVICGHEFPVGDEDRDYARSRIFGPMLGVEHVKSRRIAVGNLSLITRIDDETTLLYPSGHPRHPEYRHDWFVGEPDGVGYTAGRGIGPEEVGRHDVLVGVLKS